MENWKLLCLSIPWQQHIFFEYIKCTYPSVLYPEGDKRKESWDAWLPAAHHAIGEATSTNLKQYRGH